MRFLLCLAAGLMACTEDDKDDTGMMADADTDTDTDSDTDADTDSDTDADLPLGYAFGSRDDATVDSVVNDGQQLRHVLIADLKSFLSGLTADIDSTTFVPVAGDVTERLDFFFDFDSQTSGTVNHLVTTDPATTQTTYDDISTDKNLVLKLAGNDSSTDHRDWSTEFAGWTNAGSPEALIRSWFDAIDALAVDRANGIIPTTPAGTPIAKVFVDAEGRDYQQLIDKLLRVGITFSQGADDYLDDDVADKGLLTDHTQVADGKPYTVLEHQWDEGIGYFGISRNFAAWSDDDRLTTYVDTDGNGEIDLQTEKVWHAANNAAKRDVASATGTTFGDDAIAAFTAGRTLLATTTDALTTEQFAELQGHRDDAVEAWEKIIAATVIHYINVVVADQDQIGSPSYSFEDHAKHWGEAKGFAFAFQFNPRSPMTDQQFADLHTALREAPIIQDGGAISLADYRANILAARDLVGTVYGFDPTDVAAW
ncbi:MAG: DUF4856 domain-containing protein [Myxococcota bacterium]